MDGYQRLPMNRNLAKVALIGYFDSLWQTAEIGLSGSASLHSPGEANGVILVAWCILGATKRSEGRLITPLCFVSPPLSDRKGGNERSSPGLLGEAKDCILSFVEAKVEASRVPGPDGERKGKWLSSLKLKGETRSKVSLSAGFVRDANDLRLEQTKEVGLLW